MSQSELISKAMWAHGQWKHRLRKAVDTGSSEFSVKTVCADDQCDFGKWLNGMPPERKGAADWKNIKTLHAQFHVEAGRVLELALGGRKAEAEKALGMGSGYSKASANLIAALDAWKGG